MAITSRNTIIALKERPLNASRTVNTYRRRDRIISRTRVNANRSKATTHLRPVSSAGEFGIRAGNDDVLSGSISIHRAMWRCNSRATITLSSVLESSEKEAQPETLAYAELDGHHIARVTEDARVQSFVAPVIVVATYPVAATDDERWLECLRVSRHVRRCD